MMSLDAYFALEAREHGISAGEREMFKLVAVVRHKSLAKEAGNVRQDIQAHS